MLETFSPENLSPGYLSDKSPENISGVKETFPEQLSEGNDNVPGEPPEEFVPEEAPEELSDGNDIVPEGDSFSFSITAPEAGERIDKVLAVRIPGQSRSYLKKLIKEELIRIDGRPVKPSTCVSENETVSVVLPVRMLPDILPEDIPLDVLYEDEDVLVVNKPKGMVVHPAAGHYTGTLVNAVMYHCKGSLSGINGVLRPGIVHRIDKDTTGSIIVCKNDNAHQSIAGQLAEHTIVRRYRAIVLGNIREDTVTISQPIGRDPSDRKKMAVRPDGRQAVTNVRVLERFGNYTYIECRLETGRTHQIRVHMAHIGHPLAGDPLYGMSKAGKNSAETMCLHAYTLSLYRPFEEVKIEIRADLPIWAYKLSQDTV